MESSNIVFDGYTPASLGAVTCASGTVDHCEIRNTKGTQGIGCWSATSAVFSYNYVHDNDRYGFGGNGDGAQIIHNEISRNNANHIYAGDFDAGGTKWASGVSNYLIQYNYVHHNGGSGLWVDGDGFRCTFDSNLVEFNDFVGIDY